MIQFVAVNGRLPCPADGTIDTGIENLADPNPQIGAANCTTLLGTVPWRTLGISQDTALDAWAQKISYRVFHGPTGLTRTDGASMADCDASETGLGIPLPGNGLCDPITRDNTPEQFLAGKGLSFDDKGSITSGVAYVLISHGPTGRGAYLPGGNQTALPNAANVPERGNATNDTLIPAQRTFYARGFSDTSMSPDEPNHFDDLTRFMRIEELARKAGRGPRDWPDAADEVGFDKTTTANMTTPGVGHFQATGDAVLGQVFAQGPSANIVTLGGGGAGLYAACLWWPTPLKIYDAITSTAKSFRMVVDFSFPDLTGTPGGGLVVGFITGNTPPTITTCGTNSGSANDVLGDLGWGGGTYTTNDRFAIEIDTKSQSVVPYDDPANNHVATDWYGTYHDGATGPACTGPECIDGGSSTWLRDGHDHFHRLRIEIDPRACFGGLAPRLRAWVMPYSVCTDPTYATACEEMRLQAPYPTSSLPPGTVYIESCITPPVDAGAYDSIYFGFTSAKDAGPPEVILNLKQLQSGVY